MTRSFKIMLLSLVLFMPLSSVLVKHMAGCATVGDRPVEMSPTDQYAHALNVVNQVALQLENTWRGGLLSNEEFLATKGAMVAAYDELARAEALLPEGGEGFDVALGAAMRIAQALQKTMDTESSDGN